MLLKEKTFEFSLEGFAQAKAYKQGIPEEITDFISNIILPISLLVLSTAVIPAAPALAPIIESAPLFLYL